MVYNLDNQEKEGFIPSFYGKRGLWIDEGGPFGHAAYDMACCGEPVSALGKPYCEAHNRAAYNPPPPKAFIRGAHRAAYR